MTMRLSALGAGHPLPPGRFLVLISVRGWVDPRQRQTLIENGCLTRNNTRAIAKQRVQATMEQLFERGVFYAVIAKAT
jgi:hypothetical protein